MPFAVYDPLTGEILRVANYPAGHQGPKARPGESVTEVGADVSDASHLIVDGEPVPKP